MEDTVKKIIKTGYGLGLLSMAQAKKIAARVRKEMQFSEKESLRLAKELVANSGKVSREVLKTATSNFEAVLTKSGIAGKREMKLAKKIVKSRIKGVGKKVKEACRRR